MSGAKAIYENAKEVENYKRRRFGRRDLKSFEKKQMEVKFKRFAEEKPGIFDEIINNKLDWKQFKQLAETAYSLHLQMHTDTDPLEARNVQFS